MIKIYTLLTVLMLSCLAHARAQDTTGCNPNFQVSINGAQVYFYAADSLPGVQHFWTFGDSTTVGGGNVVSHTYSHSGNFLVTLTVTDSALHCRDSSVQTISINLNPAPLCGLSVSFTSDSSHHLYDFVANPVLYPGSTIDTIAWTINDTFAGYGDSLNKNLVNGTYTVCANLSTSLGCRTQSCVTLVVGDSMPSTPPPPDTCTIAIKAVAGSQRPNQYSFSVAGDSARYNNVQWTLMSAAMSATDSMLRKQFSGNGFTYTFTDTGYYVVTVAATTASGCGVSATQLVHIDSLPATSGGFISSYPNPATAQVNLAVTMETASTIYIRVYNSMGSEVLSTSQSGYAGVNQVVLPISSLPMGVYYIQLQFGNTVLKSKIQKL